MNQKYENSVFRWYCNEDIQNHIAGQCFKREFALLTPKWSDKRFMSTRMLKVLNPVSLMYVLQSLKFFSGKKPYQFYRSLAFYHYGIPHQTLDLVKRKKEQLNKDWIINHHTQMKGFDFVLDIDGESHKTIDETKKAMIKIHRYLNRINCPHHVKFSGTGFHIVIRGYRFPKYSFSPRDDYNIYCFYSEIAHSLKESHTDLIDASIHDSRRLIKMAYTIALFPKNAYVTYWLNSESQINNFELSEFEIHNFDKQIKGRIPTTFNNFGNTSKLIKRAEHGKEKSTNTPA